jgi:histidinol-phosphate aminotransferase
MSNLFFNETIQQAQSRIAPLKAEGQLLLDKNEQPTDIHLPLKRKVTDHLLGCNWNRYPSADNSDIEARVANYCKLDPEHIAIGPGSASFITVLLNYFALNGKRIVIAQPGYTLFDYHCKTYNIAYESWMLTEDLEYDYEQMPALGAGSVLFISTPNNPTGNTIEQTQLEILLSSNPEALIVLDAVYAEFADVDFMQLVRKYENLIVLRSFSKAFPIAGLRLGYLCAAPGTASIVRKLMLMFSINHFTLAFAREVLFSPRFLQQSTNRVRSIIAEREWMFRTIRARFSEETLRVFESKGNFLLVRIFNDEVFQKLLCDFEKNGIKVLNTSGAPLLKNTFRVSVGTPDENEYFIACLRESLIGL